jgi:hypothetical protein
VRAERRTSAVLPPGYRGAGKGLFRIVLSDGGDLGEGFLAGVGEVLIVRHRKPLTGE